MIGARLAGKEPNQLMLDVLELWPDAILQVNHPRVASVHITVGSN